MPKLIRSLTFVLQLGPFVDANHSSIKIGDVDLAPADLFKTRILGPLRAFLDDAPGTTVLIVPSVRDLISHHTVFPQPALPLPQSDVSSLTAHLLHELIDMIYLPF